MAINQITEIRFEWPAGYYSRRVTQSDALKLAVALRSLGLGLTVRVGEPVVSRQTTQFPVAECIMKRVLGGASTATAAQKV